MQFGYLDINVGLDPSYGSQNYRVYYAFSPTYISTQPFPVGLTWNLLSVNQVSVCPTLTNFGLIQVPIGNVVYFHVREDFTGTFIYETSGAPFGGDPCISTSNFYTHNFSIGSPTTSVFNLKIIFPPSVVLGP